MAKSGSMMRVFGALGYVRMTTRVVAVALCLLAPAPSAAVAREPAAAPLLRIEPEKVGLSSARLARIAPALQAEVEAGRLPGAVVAIARKGRLTYATRLKTGVANLSGSRGDFDWSGAFGTTFWVDPKEELSVVFMSQQGGLQRILMRQLIRTLVMAAVAD